MLVVIKWMQSDGNAQASLTLDTHSGKHNSLWNNPPAHPRASCEVLCACSSSWLRLHAYKCSCGLSSAMEQGEKNTYFKSRVQDEECLPHCLVTSQVNFIFLSLVSVGKVWEFMETVQACFAKGVDKGTGINVPILLSNYIEDTTCAGLCGRDANGPALFDFDL